jgi:tetratricopeptide (TPR) repeat protein
VCPNALGPCTFFTFLRFTGPIHEIDADISQSKLILSTSPRYHPRRPLCASLLGLRLLERYKLLNQKEDINEAILYLTESLLSSPLRMLAHGPMIVVDLLILADSLLMRSRMSKEPEDAISAAKYLRHLRDPAHASFAFLRQKVTTTLVVTLALQTELKASDAVQALEEMAVLTHELLTSDPSGDDTTGAIAVFTRALLPDLPDSFPDLVLNQVIECLGLARTHKPEMREVNFALSQCLIIRSECALNDDFEEAVSILDEMIASSFPGDKFIAPCQALVVRMAMIRSMNVHPENSEEAIYRARAFLTSSTVEGPLYRTWSRVLENAAKKRLKNFGPVGSLEAASNHSLHSLPMPADDSELTQETHTLDGLLDGIRNNDMTDIDEVMGKGRNILASSDPSDLGAPLLFGEILFEAFERTNKIEYLHELINADHQLLTCPLPKFQRFPVIARLIGSLLNRSRISPGQCTQDMHEVVELYPQLLDDGTTLSLRDRFQSACYWALLARENQHPSVSTAYETALSLMQDTLLFAPTLQLQHDILALGDGYRDMPLDYASYQVELGHLEQAIETLEKGRALLWSEMRHLRISIDQFLKADPDLGGRFAAVNRDLEELTKSIPPSHKISIDDVIADDLRAGDKFGQLLRKQRGLLKEREELISQIKALPDFDRFLASPSFDTLRSAASSGPVIIINHSKRSDILILVHNSSPSLIPTPTDFYHRANTLKDKLLNSRVKDGLNSSKYDQALASVLTELYKLIGKPVIERLRQLQVPDQSRIWWCPTSVFCSLPLHAMGPIPSEDGELRYFLDLYISSYTPSLSALIQSHNRDSDSRSSDRPSVLLVAQTDSSLPTVEGEIQVVRALDTEVTSLISEAATPAAVLDCFNHN